MFLHAQPAPERTRASWPELATQLEARLRRLCPRALFDSRHDRVRALAPLTNGVDDAVERLRAACQPLGREQGLIIGLSDVDRGAASARRRMREAADAAAIGRSLVAEGGASATSSWAPTATWSTSISSRLPGTATGARSSSSASTTTTAAPS